MIHCGATKVMIDCGADWLDLLHSLSPTAIMLTHAHPDHAGGLAHGAPCPVYSTSETLALLRRFPIQNPRTVKLRTLKRINELRFEAFPVAHSMRAPAVGYRIAARRRCVFYVPDVAAIRNLPGVRRRAFGRRCSRIAARKSSAATRVRSVR